MWVCFLVCVVCACMYHAVLIKKYTCIAHHKQRTTHAGTRSERGSQVHTKRYHITKHCTIAHQTQHERKHTRPRTHAHTHTHTHTRTRTHAHAHTSTHIHTHLGQSGIEGLPAPNFLGFAREHLDHSGDRRFKTRAKSRVESRRVE